MKYRIIKDYDSQLYYGQKSSDGIIWETFYNIYGLTKWGCKRKLKSYIKKGSYVVDKFEM